MSLEAWGDEGDVGEDVCPCVHYERDNEEAEWCACGHSPEEHEPECTAAIEPEDEE